MGMHRRDFLKVSVGAGIFLASKVPSAIAAPTPLPPEAVGILYDATLCIGCKSCLVNCKKYNSMEGGALYKEGRGIPYEHISPEKIYDAPGGLSATTLNIIKIYSANTGEQTAQGENSYSFVKQHCFHCIDPACASVCPVGALHKNSVTGVVAYEPSKCIGCRYCQVACPFGIPKFEWESTSPQIRKCQMCHHRFDSGGYSACCEFCPTGASIFGRVADLREEAKRRISLKPGNEYAYPLQTVNAGQTMPKKTAHYVNHIYGMNEAGGTQYLVLAGVSFDKLGFNPNISSQAYPDLTWSYILKVPALVGIVLAAGTASHFVTRRNKKTNQEKQHNQQ